MKRTREDLIKGLTICTTPKEEISLEMCAQCPYVKYADYHCDTILMKDALEYIQSKEE